MEDILAQRPQSEPDFACEDFACGDFECGNLAWKFCMHAKSGSGEGLWAETSSIYINYQHLCGLHKRE